jgi:L-2-hydroxyglutarate oxidase LhgO
VEFCREYAIPHNVCGKVIVATAMLPEITENDLVPRGSGVRAQALKPDGALGRRFSVPTSRQGAASSKCALPSSDGFAHDRQYDRGHRATSLGLA